jgi:regulator of sigma E protease
MTVVATIIVLGVLIFVHELGHFWAAKAVGIEVQRFSIGLGPKIFGFTRGETEYVISAIPLGGYVKMGGMDDEVMERIEGGAEGEDGQAPRREPSDRDFDAKPIWARTIVISAGVIMNMLFAFGVYTFLAASYGERQLDTTRIGRVDAATLPAGAEALATVEAGSRFVRIGGSPTEHWGDVQTALFEGTPGPVEIDLVEPTRSIQIQIPETEAGRRALTASVAYWIDAGVGQVEPGGPADRADLEAGDRVLAVNGEATENWFTFLDQIRSRPGQRVEVTIERGGRELVRAINLESSEQERPDGSTVTEGRAGINSPLTPLTYEPVPLGQAVVAGYRDTVAITGLIVGFLRDLVTGGVSPRSVGSIVTIGAASGEAAAAGLDTFLGFMALFSVNLAVLNLLPIPVLDGGHLLFLAIEAIRGGRGLSVEQRLKLSNVGFVILVGIMLWALSNDVLRLFGI